MGLKASDLLGTSQVGVHLAMIGRVLFAPLQISKKEVASLEDTLGLEVAQMSVGGSTLVGSLIAGNTNGIAVADIATEEEIDHLTSFGDGKWCQRSRESIDHQRKWGSSKSHFTPRWIGCSQ